MVLVFTSDRAVLSWFELGMFITGGQKKLSVMLSICVSFAPFLQWWFAINGLVEMLIYGACFVLEVTIWYHMHLIQENRSGSRYGSLRSRICFDILSDMDGASGMGLCSIIFVGCHLEI